MNQTAVSCRDGRVCAAAPAHGHGVAGGRAEVTWQITANHGGGYQYRLCPASAPPTESCFAAHPLSFDTAAQRLQWNNGTTTHIKD